MAPGGQITKDSGRGQPRDLKPIARVKLGSPHAPEAPQGGWLSDSLAVLPTDAPEPSPRRVTRMSPPGDPQANSPPRAQCVIQSHALFLKIKAKKLTMAVNSLGAQHRPDFLPPATRNQFKPSKEWVHARVMDKPATLVTVQILGHHREPQRLGRPGRQAGGSVRVIDPASPALSSPSPGPQGTRACPPQHVAHAEAHVALSHHFQPVPQVQLPYSRDEETEA